MAPPALNPVEATLRRIAEELASEGWKWALIGGLVVSARGAAEPFYSKKYLATRR